MPQIVLVITSTDSGNELGRAEDVSFQLYQHGLVGHLLAALAALPSIQLPSAPLASIRPTTADAERHSASSQPGVEPAAVVRNGGNSGWPHQTLYPGYRKDLVAGAAVQHSYGMRRLSSCAFLLFG